MVVGNVSDAWSKSSVMESKTLKFGMDRILSEDTKRNKSNLEDPCEAKTSCSACVASLYRCRRMAPESDVTILCRNDTCASLPFTLYSTVLNRTEDEGPNFNREGQVSKRKKSWSRAVFSNLQRKGLEKRFQLQKYITKPDRRQLAATLGLTDAQVKVWFQNRRMKWRHARESFLSNSPTDGESGPDCPRRDNMDLDSDDAEVDVQTLDN